MTTLTPGAARRRTRSILALLVVAILLGLLAHRWAGALPASEVTATPSAPEALRGLEVSSTAPGPAPGDLPAVRWEAWFDLFGGAVLAALAVLPVAVLAAWALARRRCLAGSAPARAWCMSLADVGIVGATAAALWLTVAPGSRALTGTGGVSLVPLQDLATMGTFQVVGNLLLLAVPGFLLPLRYPALASVPRILAVAAAGSLLIETTQYVLMLDRVSSVDDVLLNTAGAGLAALLSRPYGGAQSLRCPKRGSRRPLVRLGLAAATGNGEGCWSGQPRRW